MTVYIIEQSYYKQNGSHSWQEYTHGIAEVYRQREDAIKNLRAVYEYGSKIEGVYDLVINETAVNPYVMYHWKDNDEIQQERFLQIVSREAK